jgi:thymidylate synthase
VIDLVIPDMRSGYLQLVNYVELEGVPVSPRGYNTLEVEDATFRLMDPRDALPLGVGRGPKLAIGAAEALCLVGGITDAYMFTKISPTFKRFLNGGDLHGGYGRRVGPQLQQVFNRLQEDPDTRQAIIQIWDPLYDNQAKKDIPCTLGFNFRIRDGKLNMSTTMRSNDVWLGTCYDVFTFTQLQLTLANALGVEVGHYTHHVYSLHLYERNFDDIKKLKRYSSRVHADELKSNGLSTSDFAMQGFGVSGEPITTSINQAAAIHDGTCFVPLTMSEQTYEKVLRPFARLTGAENFES